jgi:hypothetical protein
MLKTVGLPHGSTLARVPVPVVMEMTSVDAIRVGETLEGLLESEMDSIYSDMLVVSATP